MTQNNWAVVIGINKYWSRSSNLSGSVADALRMREWLLCADGGAVTPNRLSLFLAPMESEIIPPGITFKDATNLNISEVFPAIERRSGDRLFFYFAGHGIIDPRNYQDDAQLLIPTDCSPRRPNNVLPLLDIVNFCKHAKFSEQFFISDACRTPWLEKNLVFSNFLYFPKRSSKKVNQFILYSTSTNSPAYDGIFTRVLLKGLSGDGDSKKWDPTTEQYTVTFNSLFDYVTAQLPKLQIARRGGESGGIDGRPNDPILSVFAIPLPRARPGRFSVGVANFEHDPKRELERILVDQLSNIDDTIDVLRLGRPIIQGFQQEEKTRTAREAAKKIIEETMIDVLIWGEALSLDLRTGARLHFATKEKTIRAESPYPIDDFEFPEMFWDDLADFVSLRVSEQGTEFYVDTIFEEGRRVLISQLDQFIAKTRLLLAKPARQLRWTADMRASLAAELAAALVTSADQSQIFALDDIRTRTDKLKEAADLFTLALDEWTESRGFERRATLGNLATLQRRLGHLPEAVEGLRQLKELYNQADDPPICKAINLYNLGNAICELGEQPENRFASPAQFREAASVLAEVIASSPPRSPFWAAALEARGRALLRLAEVTRQLSERRSLLNEAEAEVRKALPIFDPDQEPLRWTNAMQTLAVVLRREGETSSGNEQLKEAVQILSAVVDRYPNDRSLMWAFYQDSFANALAALGKRANNPDYLQQALKIRSDIVPIFRSEEDHEGVRQSVCKILSEIRTLGQIDVNFSQWLTVNRSALANIDPEIELMVSKL
jgi:tetratricopeptide (TPR) repeat protein